MSTFKVGDNVVSSISRCDITEGKHYRVDEGGCIEDDAGAIRCTEVMSSDYNWKLAFEDINWGAVKKGDFITYIGSDNDLTVGKRYEIVLIDSAGDAKIYDDAGDTRWPNLHDDGTWSLGNSLIFNNGDRVTLRSGDVYIYIDGLLLKPLGGYILIDSYTSEFTIDYNDSYDIMMVNSKPEYESYYLQLGVKGPITWEREEVIEEPTQELTVAEIEAKLGYKVKVVK